MVMIIRVIKQSNVKHIRGLFKQDKQISILMWIHNKVNRLKSVGGIYTLENEALEIK